MAKKLEDHKVFPYVAWVTIVGFALFVYFLTTNIYANVKGLDDKTLSNAKIENFLRN